jgi:hypothetical protein
MLPDQTVGWEKCLISSVSGESLERLSGSSSSIRWRFEERDSSSLIWARLHRKEELKRGSSCRLRRWRRRAAKACTLPPTDEHFQPLTVAAGNVF